MPNILAIDTTSALCQVGLKTASSAKYSVCNERRVHAQRLLPMVDELLSEERLKLEDLDLISVCTGPGSFTGIRIGVGVAQGLAMALSKPVFGISSLEALAYCGLKRLEDTNDALLVAALFARTDEVYFAVYRSEGGEIELCGSEKVAAVDNLGEIFRSELAAYAIGNGWQYDAPLRKSLDGYLTVKETLDSELEVAPISDTLELVSLRLPKLDLQQLSLQPIVPNYLKEHLVYSN